MVSGGSDGRYKRRRITSLEALFCILAILGTAVVIYATGGASGINTGRNEVNARQHYDQVKKDALETCVGREGPALSDCAIEAVETAQEQSVSRQDLYAQQDMSKWSFWMVLLTFSTVIVTGAGVYFVKLTLDTNSDFLKESIKATKAMNRQNDIAKAAQRPWININIEPTILKRHGGSIRFEAKIKCKNLGVVAGRNFQLRFKLKYTPTGDFDEVRDIWDGFEIPTTKSRKIAIPRDTEEFPFWSYHNIDTLNWKENTTGPDTIIVLFVVSVIYQSDVTGDEWLRTDKAYAIAHRTKNQTISEVLPRNFRNIRKDRLLASQIVAATLGH